MSNLVYKGVLVALSTTVVIPYAVAILCNFLYGWPIEEKKYRRALHPKKVYALNWSVLKKLAFLKVSALVLRGKYLYYTVDESRLIKNIPFGSNDNKLDLYFPQPNNNGGMHPVVIFIYGGGWSSGDKSIYALICTQFADKLQAVVVCPNYSTYPKGYADDMIQDVVDCLAWIHDNIDKYGGKGDQLMMIGHSAGAHLCVMAVLELYRQVPEELQDLFLRRFTPRSITPRLTPLSSSPRLGEPFQFDDHYYNDGDDTNGIPRNGSGDRDSESFIVLSDSQQNNQELLEASLGASLGSFNVVSQQTPLTIRTEQQPLLTESHISKNDQEPQPETGRGSDSSGSSVQVVPQVDFNLEKQSHFESVADYRPRSHVACMMQSVRAVIGLSGVYDIEDHYHFQYEQGIEDINPMARAMYGIEHFHRFSPRQIVQELSSTSCLPYMVIVHGSKDDIVPVTSSTIFVDAVNRALPEQQIDLKIIPACNHVDVCFDLSLPSRKFYSPVMGTILRTAQKVF